MLWKTRVPCFKSEKESVVGRSEAAIGGVFCKKGVLRNFAKFTGKHLC